MTLFRQLFMIAAWRPTQWQKWSSVLLGYCRFFFQFFSRELIFAKYILNSQLLSNYVCSGQSSRVLRSFSNFDYEEISRAHIGYYFRINFYFFFITAKICKNYSDDKISFQHYLFVCVERRQNIVVLCVNGSFLLNHNLKLNDINSTTVFILFCRIHSNVQKRRIRKRSWIQQ